VALDEAAKSSPLFGIDYVITALAPPGYVPDKIFFGFPESIKRISSVYLSTSKETVQTYLMWRVVDDLVLNVVAAEMEPLQNLKVSLVDLVSRWIPPPLDHVG
jgi:endothelin-converting enzyme